MLRNPDPADWLMIRRDYKANSFSPLNQITTQNVSVDWERFSPMRFLEARKTQRA